MRDETHDGGRRRTIQEKGLRAHEYTHWNIILAVVVVMAKRERHHGDGKN